MENNLKKIIGTHSGAFHADDVFAVATLSMLFPDYEIHRSRDPEVWAKCDYLVDVGGSYDHEQKIYDHHFKDGPTYDDGLKMSSIGLIWKHYGAEVCGSEQIAARVCRCLIRQFDAIDNGVALTESISAFEDTREVSLSGAIGMMNPQDHSKADYVFAGEVVRARLLLQASIAQAKHWADSKTSVVHALEKALANNDAYIVVPEGCKWIEHLFNSADNESILYAIFPNAEKYYVRTVPSAPGEFSNRKDLPKAWAGLNNEAFSEVAGISDGVFCHHGLFICAAGSLESAIKLVEDAVEA